MAIQAAGGGAALARQLKVRRQAIYQWQHVPVSRVLDVERITGVSRHDLRPDVFGPAPTIAQPTPANNAKAPENFA